MHFTRPWYDLRAGEEGHRRFDIAIAMSVLLHAAALFLVAPTVLKHALTPGEVEGPVSAPISVSLAPRPRPPVPQVEPVSPPPSPPPATAPTPRRERPAARPTLPPMASIPAEPSPETLKVPPPTLVPLPPPPRPTPRPASPPVETDLAAYIAARRAERGEPSPAPAAQGEAARRDRALERNLASLNTPRPFVGNPKSGGGLFQVTLKSYDFAEFRFFGWSPEARRRAPQRFEVRKGDNPTIDIAIVKRMIEIIRQTEKGDFVWRSERLGHEVTLSARPEDTQRLEEFLLRDMFG